MNVREISSVQSRPDFGSQLCLPVILTLYCLTAVPAIAQSASPEILLPQLAHMELAVEVNYDAERLSGTSTLTLRNPSDSPLRRVPLILNRVMRVTAVASGDGQELAYRQQVTSFEDFEIFQVNAIEVDLETPVPAGESVRLLIAYEGPLVGYTETGMQYVRDHISREFTMLREDARAFPMVGVASIETNRAAPRVPFDFEVSVTVPRNLVVATGGEQIARVEEDSLVTWRYRSRAAAPYVIITIAPYLVARERDLRVFYFPEDSLGARAMLDASLRAAGRYQEIFGPLDRPLALTIMEIPDGWGSQASLAGGIIQVAGAFRDADRMPELYHELSHLWNATDLDTPSPRWNEGLAMFLQGRIARELDGWRGESEAYDRTGARLLERCGGGGRCGSIPLGQFGEERLTDYSYSVGRLMFAALYAALGEEAFDRALRAHFQAHRASGTRTDDMVQAFVDEGGPAARRIFDDWLDTTAWLDLLREAGSAQRLLDSYRTRADLPAGRP